MGEGELVSEDVPQEQPAATDVMSHRPASIGKASVAVSPVNGVVLPATADTAARARAGKVALKQRLQQAALDGMLTATQAVAAGVFTHEQAWGKIIEGQTELALSPDLRGSTQAAALVGKAIGATERDKDEGGGGNTISMSLSDAAVAQIAAALAGRLDQDE